MVKLRATARQKIALDNMVANGGNVSRAMIDAGYSEATAHTPKKLTESVGFKELMKECGLTENLIAKALVEDIISKPANRIGELRLGSEILGMKAVEGSGDKTLVLMITGETAKRYVRTNTSTGADSDRPSQV